MQRGFKRPATSFPQEAHRTCERDRAIDQRTGGGGSEHPEDGCEQIHKLFPEDRDIACGIGAGPASGGCWRRLSRSLGENSVERFAGCIHELSIDNQGRQEPQRRLVRGIDNQSPFQRFNR